MANLFIGIGGSGVKTIANLKGQLKSSDPELFKKLKEGRNLINAVN